MCWAALLQSKKKKTEKLFNAEFSIFSSFDVEHTNSLFPDWKICHLKRFYDDGWLSTADIMTLDHLGLSVFRKKKPTKKNVTLLFCVEKKCQCPAMMLWGSGGEWYLYVCSRFIAHRHNSTTSYHVCVYSCTSKPPLIYSVVSDSLTSECSLRISSSCLMSYSFVFCFYFFAFYIMKFMNKHV